MKLREVIDVLDSWAPFALQEEWDNSGLQIGDPEMEVSGIMISLDATQEVLDEAIGYGCNVIISHHPFMFKGIRKITPEMNSFSLIRSVIINDLAIISVHTNLDNRVESLNHFLGRKIGLSEIRVLRPRTGYLKKLVTFCPVEHSDNLREALFEAGAGHIGNYDCCSFSSSGQGSFRASERANPFVGEKLKLHFEDETRIEVVFPAHSEDRLIGALLKIHPYEEVAYDIYPLDNKFYNAGAGIIGELPEPRDAEIFLQSVRSSMELIQIRHTKPPGRPISTVSICSGAGAFLIGDAISGKADAYITGDLKYHDFQDLSGQLLLVDIGHYESERYVKEILAKVLIEKFPNFAVLISESEVNPVKYF